MENTKAPMKDKETKEEFEKFVTEECGGGLWGDDGTGHYEASLYDVKDKVWGFISKLEQEAERRGAIKTCKRIYDYVEAESGTSGRREILQYIAKLKLLEEENGKQNGR